MSTLTAPNPLAVLDNLSIGSPKNDSATDTPPQISMSERVLDALEVARVYAEQIEESDYRKNVQDKLVRSNVRGSLVIGVKEPDDVVSMLRSATGWREVVANLKDKEITVLEGILPANYVAFTAYASVREIALLFGASGLGAIQAKQGYQQEDDYYFCTMSKVPTDIVTVQLKTSNGQEHLHQWFAGKEVTSRGRFNDGDTIVRCGVVIPLLAEQRQKKDTRNERQGRRPYRAD